MQKLLLESGLTGQLEKAVELFRESLDHRQRNLAGDHPGISLCMYGLAQALRLQGKIDEAIRLFEQTLERGTSQAGGLPAKLRLLPELLAEVYLKAGRLEDTETRIRTVLDDYRTLRGKNSVDSLRAQSTLALILFERDELAEAEVVMRENLDSYVAKHPDDWQTFRSKSILGAILMKQRRYEESEALLTSGYEGLQVRAAEIPSGQREKRLAVARNWLAQLYLATNRIEEPKRLEFAEQISKHRRSSFDPTWACHFVRLLKDF